MNNGENEDTQKEQSIADSAREEKVSELEILKQSVEEKQSKADDYYDQLLRLRAELDDSRKRSEVEKKNHKLWGKEEVLLKQIGILDILRQALLSAKNSHNIESLVEGLEMVCKEFDKVISDEGVSQIEPLGKKFDPLLHEAVDRIESDEPEGTVLEVMQRGYKMNDRLIRAAKVKVSKSKNTEKK